MSDLISRSELINALKVHFDSCFREDGELLYSDHICTSDDVVDLIKLVENQPTAYSVDKVVKELEVLKDGYDHSCLDNVYERGVEAGAKWIKKKAIEIVKQGGVSDDVCECRRLNGYNFLYKTSCGNIFDMGNVFKFCPYCRKKIKVIE